MIPAGMRLFKILGSGGEAIHGGSGTWHLPAQKHDGTDEPGAWMPKLKSKPVACNVGYHLTPKPIDFYVPGSRVFEAEWRGMVDDEQIETPNSPKVAVSEARLLREVDWGEFCVWLDGEHKVRDGYVIASGNATVTASGNATVTAYGNATVTAYDNATVTASDNATVRAYGSATVRASDNATVRAYGSATVTAYGSATVTASDNATVRAYGSANIISSTYHHASAVVALADMAAHIDRRDGKVSLRSAMS